jgi:hypothetical protein
MIKMLIPFMATALVGCGSTKPKKPQPIKPELSAKAELYEQLVKLHQDPFGFIMTDQCDSTLFSGLLSAAMPVEILAAQSAPGVWHRRPGHDCGPSFGNSRSSISRDMMVGVFYYLWYNDDLKSATELMEDLKSNDYKLRGEGTVGELLMTPAMMNTLAELIKKMGGKSYERELLMPAVFGKEDGFVAHLTVWHILLRGQILGAITDLDKDILSHHRHRQPKNPFFLAAYHKYTDGNFDEPVTLLMDDSEWPNDRLPTQKEHCSNWPIERDYTEKDWGPCNEGSPKVHSGAELILIYKIIMRN